MQSAVRHKLGFTLIELLVVVAIIGILAGLLMPALAAAQKKGRAISCLSNLHQWGLAINMYCDDNDDVIPFETDSSGADQPTWTQIKTASTSGSAWYNALPPYVQALGMSNYQQNINGLYKSSTILECPGVVGRVTNAPAECHAAV